MCFLSQCALITLFPVRARTPSNLMHPGTTVSEPWAFGSHPLLILISLFRQTFRTGWFQSDNHCLASHANGRTKHLASPNS